MKSLNREGKPGLVCWGNQRRPFGALAAPEMEPVLREILDRRRPHWR